MESQQQSTDAAANAGMTCCYEINPKPSADADAAAIASQLKQLHKTLVILLLCRTKEEFYDSVDRDKVNTLQPSDTITEEEFQVFKTLMIAKLKSCITDLER
jgi:hypothetical protein